jgi:hypothetical protein
MKLAALLCTISMSAHSMCYIVEDEQGRALYVSERAPVDMSVESPSKLVQEQFPGGHILIVTDCPLTSAQHEQRRIQLILELRSAAAHRAQYGQGMTSSTVEVKKPVQTEVYAGLVPSARYHIWPQYLDDPYLYQAMIYGYAYRPAVAPWYRGWRH